MQRRTSQQLSLRLVPAGRFAGLFNLLRLVSWQVAGGVFCVCECVQAEAPPMYPLTCFAGTSAVASLPGTHLTGDVDLEVGA